MKKHMKLSWGKGIAITIVFFMIITFVMVGISFMQKNDLVANNYYEKELKYQEQIDIKRNSALLKESVSLMQNGNIIEVRFPASLDFSSVMGNIKFYRPSDKEKDFSLPLKLDDNGEMVIVPDQIAKGLWKVQLNWSLKDKNYFNEETLLIH
jgi:hypothetical protein